MSKEFDLFNVMFILTVVCLSIAAISIIDFSSDFDFNLYIENVSNSLGKPLNLTNWHFLFLIYVIWIRRGK